MTTQQSRTFRTLLLAVTIAPEEIGRRIKKAREARGWTQLVFATEANVSPSTIQRWESGRLPPIRELIRIAGVLRISTDVLVEPEEQDRGLDGIREELAAEVARMRDLNDRMAARLDAPAAPRRGRRPA